MRSWGWDVGGLARSLGVSFCVAGHHGGRRHQHPRPPRVTSDFIAKCSELNVAGHGLATGADDVTAGTGARRKVEGVWDMRFFCSADHSLDHTCDRPPLSYITSTCGAYSIRHSPANCGHKNGGGGDDDDKIGECKNICESVANLEL